MMRTLAMTSAFLFACAPADDRPAEPPAVPAAMPMVRLAGDSLTFAMTSGYDTPATVVVRDSSAWVAAWNTVHGAVMPVPPLPAVDFSTEMVVLVAIGQQPNGGHSVRLLSASYDSAGVAVVEAEHRIPAATCNTSQALVQPVDLARLPHAHGEVRFVVTPITYDCPP